MADAATLEALRRWRAAPDEPAARHEAVVAHRRAGQPLPWDLLIALPRWARVARFVEKWFERPLAPEDGASADSVRAQEQRLGFDLPEITREWFQLVGRRRGLYQGMNEPLDLHSHRLNKRGELVLCRGHQGVCEWYVEGTRLAEANPPVYLSIGDEPELLGPLEDFYLALLVEQVGYVYSPPEGLAPYVQRWIRWDRDEGALASVRQHYARLPIPTLFQGAYGDADTIVVDDGVELMSFAVRSDAASRRLRERLGEVGWEGDAYDPVDWSGL